MNEVEYHKLYEEDPEVKEYIRKLARSYNTTEDTVLKWAYRKGFENGLEQAWECARKIVGCEIPWEAFDLRVGQSSDKAILKYSASEAIAKVKEYEGGVTRQSIIKSQLEDIITGFTEPVTSQEIIDALVQIKENQND